MKLPVYLLFALLALSLAGRRHRVRPAPQRPTPVLRVLRSPQPPKVVLRVKS